MATGLPPSFQVGSVEWLADQDMQDMRGRSGVTSITLGKSEQQIAAEYRQRASDLLGPVVDLINEARRDGMMIGFQIGPPDGFNRQSLVLLEITKKLC